MSKQAKNICTGWSWGWPCWGWWAAAVADIKKSNKLWLWLRGTMRPRVSLYSRFAQMFISISECWTGQYCTLSLAVNVSLITFCLFQGVYLAMKKNRGNLVPVMTLNAEILLGDIGNGFNYWFFHKLNVAKIMSSYRFDQTLVEMHFAEVKMGIVSLGWDWKEVLT